MAVCALAGATGPGRFHIAAAHDADPNVWLLAADRRTVVTVATAVLSTVFASQEGVPRSANREDARVPAEDDEGAAPRVVHREEDDSLGIVAVHHTGAQVWIVTSGGTCRVFSATSQQQIGHCSVERCVTATAVAGGASATDGAATLLVANFEGDVSEVFALSHRGKAGETPAVRGLFRAAEEIETLTCVNDLVLIASCGGNVDAWSLEANEDVSARFGNASFDAATHGAPQCSAVVGSTLWLGTTGGALVVVRLDEERAAAPRVLVRCHHTQAVRQIVHLPHAGHVWTLGLDALILVWDAETQQPVGAYDAHTAPLTGASVLQRTFITRVGVVDAEGAMALWTVEAPAPAPAASSAASSAALSFVQGLCGLLESSSGQRGAGGGGSASAAVPVAAVSVPPSLARELPSAAFLCDALLTLHDSREVLERAFSRLAWRSESFTSDLRRLARHTVASVAKLDRVAEAATQLAPLCSGDYPLPREVEGDALEELLWFASVLVEQLHGGENGQSRVGVKREEEAEECGGGGISTGAASEEARAALMEQYEARLMEEMQARRSSESECAALRRELEDARAAAADAEHRHARECGRLKERAAALSTSLGHTKARMDAQTAEYEGRIAELTEAAAMVSSASASQREQDLQRTTEQLREEVEELKRQCRAHAAVVDELEAKNVLVQELLGYVKENANTIDELRGRLVAKRGEVSKLHQATGRLSQAADAAQSEAAALRSVVKRAAGAATSLLQGLHGGAAMERVDLLSRVAALHQQLHAASAPPARSHAKGTNEWDTRERFISVSPERDAKPAVSRSLTV